MSVILGLFALFLVLLVVGVIVGMVIHNNNKPKPKPESAQRRIKATRKRIPRTLAPRSMPVARPPVHDVTKVCTQDSDCGQDQECDLARMYHVENFNADRTPTNLTSVRLQAWSIPTLEKEKLSVVDMLEYKQTLFVATTAPYVYVQSKAGAGRLVKTNIVADDIAIYDSNIIALSGGSMYAASLAHVMADEWTFEHFMGHDNIISIESSADGRGLIVTTPVSTLVYVDGQQKVETPAVRRIFGSSPGEYAEFHESQALLLDAGNNEETLVPNADAGIFTQRGDFFHVNSSQARDKVSRIRQVANQPVFVSERFCKLRNTKSVRQLTL